MQTEIAWEFQERFQDVCSSIAMTTRCRLDAALASFQPRNSTDTIEIDAEFDLKQFDRAWSDLHKFEESGGQPNPEFVKVLNEARKGLRSCPKGGQARREDAILGDFNMRHRARSLFRQAVSRALVLQCP